MGDIDLFLKKNETVPTPPQINIEEFLRKIQIEKSSKKQNPSLTELKKLIQCLADGWSVNLDLDEETKSWIERLKQLPKEENKQRTFDTESYHRAANLWHKMKSS